MKIKIKKSILSLFLIMLISFTFVGCNNKNDESINATENETKKEEASGETKKLVIAARGGSHVDAINSVKESFEKENNVEIEILGLEADDLKQRVSLDSQNSEGSYDVVMIDDPWMSEWAKGDVLLNLSDNGVKKDDDFIEASQNVGTYPYKEGDIYALPFNGNVMMFFYNEQLLKENSIEVPTDWESVLQAAKTVKKTGKNGYIIRGQQGNPIVTDYLPILWAYGGDVFDKDNNITIDSQEAIDALNLYIELYKNGENYIAFIGPSYLSYHHHDHDLSFWLYKNGNIFTEVGKYGYDWENPKTQYVRTYPAHNSVVIDGEDNISPSILNGEMLNLGENKMASISKRSQKAEVYREIDFNDDLTKIDVKTSIFPKDDKEKTYELYFHLAPEIKAVLSNDGNSVELFRADEKIGTVLCEEKMELKKDMYYSKSYDKGQKTEVIYIKTSGLEKHINLEINLK